MQRNNLLSLEGTRSRPESERAEVKRSARRRVNQYVRVLRMCSPIARLAIVLGVIAIAI
jgi:hypothetical protein